MIEIRKFEIVDRDGIVEDKVEDGIESERFLFNFDEEEARRELEALEEAERATGVHI